MTYQAVRPFRYSSVLLSLHASNKLSITCQVHFKLPAYCYRSVRECALQTLMTMPESQRYQWRLRKRKQRQQLKQEQTAGRHAAEEHQRREQQGL
jgi:hypothetical protein